MKHLLFHSLVLALVFVASPLCADPIVSTQSYEIEGSNKRGSDTLSFTGYIAEKISELDSFGAYWQGSVAASNGSTYSIANLGTMDEVKGTLLTWSATGTLGNSKSSSLHLHFSLSISPLVGEDAETYVPGSVTFTRENTVYTRKGGRRSPTRWRATPPSSRPTRKRLSARQSQRPNPATWISPLWRIPRSGLSTIPSTR